MLRILVSFHFCLYVGYFFLIFFLNTDVGCFWLYINFRTLNMNSLVSYYIGSFMFKYCKHKVAESKWKYFIYLVEGKRNMKENASWDVGADVVFYEHKHGKQRYIKSLLGNYSGGMQRSKKTWTKCDMHYLDTFAWLQKSISDTYLSRICTLGY